MNESALIIVSMTGKEFFGIKYTITVHTTAIVTTNRFCHENGCILNLYQRKPNRIAL
jgi:hypothetical protein